MHDIWNPWHGCHKKSEGCANCYMFNMDKGRGLDPTVVRRSKTGFRYPLQKDRYGQYKIQSGEQLSVCLVSDFFLPEADAWRQEAWDIMRVRRDVKFWLLTKRPELVADRLPDDWGDGWENISLNVSTENQIRADERIPILLDLPFKHKGIMCAPFIGQVDIGQYLDADQIEQVLADGENYNTPRPCHFEWVKLLSEQCRAHNITFIFYGTGENFVKDGRLYHLPDKRVQRLMAYKSGTSFKGRETKYKLYDKFGLLIEDAEKLYHPTLSPKCETCTLKITCEGRGCR
jgi:protein gp37